MAANKIVRIVDPFKNGVERLFFRQHHRPAIRIQQPPATVEARLKLEEEFAGARRYMAQFNPAFSIPRDIADISYSRSSGPGGQNVNKVNSKATLKVKVQDLTQFLPHVLWAPIGRSSYYTKGSASLVIHSDQHRHQSDNVKECWQKLIDLIYDAAKVIPRETSESQKKRVKMLEAINKARNTRQKTMHSQKKAARRAPRNCD